MLFVSSKFSYGLVIRRQRSNTKYYIFNACFKPPWNSESDFQDLITDCIKIFSLGFLAISVYTFSLSFIVGLLEGFWWINQKDEKKKTNIGTKLVACYNL